VLHAADGSTRVLPSMFSVTIGEGDLYVHRTAGGGGWGDPRKRDPDAVGDDVRDGKVTPEAAKELYGWNP
jgi:N-methylhydantoinase B